MNGLIQKSGYIKPGGGGGSYARYIATRDGVELIEGRQAKVIWHTSPSAPALMACSLQTVLRIWIRLGRCSMHTLARCGPSSIP